MNGKERKIAIPLFGERVSPTCEFSNQMLVIDISGGKVNSKEIVAIGGLNPMQKAGYIAETGICEFICAGVPGFFRRMLEASGVRVIRTMYFEPGEIIDCVLKGEPLDMGPSCGRADGAGSMGYGGGKGGRGRKGRRGGAGGGPAPGGLSGPGKGRGKRGGKRFDK